MNYSRFRLIETPLNRDSRLIETDIKEQKLNYQIIGVRLIRTKRSSSNVLSGIDCI